jgi:hypothetical protein
MDVDLVSSAAVAAALIRAKITPTIVRADFTGASFVIRMVNELSKLVFRAPTIKNLSRVTRQGRAEFDRR